MINIDPKLIDFELPEHDGYPEALAAGDTPDALRDAAGDTARDFPKNLWVEPNQWAEFAAETTRNKRWPENYRARFTNQNPTHECTCHALVQVAEMCRNRQRGSLEDAVYFSPLSIYSEANPRQWGGASCRQVLNISVSRGFLPDKIQPKDYGFKHTLHGTTGKGNATQSSGDWVRLSSFPVGWEETAKFLKPQEIVFPDSWEQIVCLVLHGYAVGVGRSGHSIPYVQWLPEKQLMAYSDSYDIIRYDSPRMIRSAVGGAYSIISFSPPDDWRKPAG